MMRTRFQFALLALALAFGACTKDNAKPASPNGKLLLVHDWRLSETRLNGLVTGRDTAIKDRYDWHFVSGGTYHLSYLDAGWTPNGTLQGQWQLQDVNDHILHTVDHKNAPHDYTIQQLDADTLRLSWEERAGELHEDIYLAR
jgi:hypothetical protein